MMPNQLFAPKRFLTLFREETTSGYKLTFIVLSVVFVFLIFVFTLAALDGAVSDLHEFWYPLVLFAGGFYFTSTSFNRLNRKEQRLSYLTIPASTFEKFSLKLLITTLGYVFVATLTYWLFAQLIDVIVARYFGLSLWTFDPFSSDNLLLIQLYLVLQAVFIIGAATFNRFSFFKTAFALLLTLLGFLFFMWLCLRIVFADFFEDFFFPRDNMSAVPSRYFLDVMEYTVWPLLQYLFWFLLAPILWTIAYFKLKEREV